MEFESYRTNFLESKDTIKVGMYANIVLEKYAKKFGDVSADQFKSNAIKTLKSFQSLEKDGRNRNILLVGKVQSGKTANMEVITGMLFDNNYNMVVLYGGYDNFLLEQTYKRFQNSFVQSEEKAVPDVRVLCSSDQDITANLTFAEIARAIENKTPIIVVSMKRPVALRRINKAIKKYGHLIKVAIFDDEGDQASLNTKFRKNDSSATYKEISDMIDTFNNPPYISVTATPHANVFLGEQSKIRPQAIQTIAPSSGYTGADFFHTDESKIIFIPQEDVVSFEKEQISESLINAVEHFIVSSAIMKKQGIEKTSMIIHTAREISAHCLLYIQLLELIKQIKNKIVQSSNEEAVKYLSEFEKIYQNDNYFSAAIRRLNHFSELIPYMAQIISNMDAVLKNSLGNKLDLGTTDASHTIFIGGDLIQRGITFEGLVTTFFTRWSNTSNMDTVLQRCRWFGYRDKYIDLCKIFTTQPIMFQLNELADSYTDLWEQLKDVENGISSIDDIVIKATDELTLNPARKSVVDYTKSSFSSPWKKQNYCGFDKNIIKKNNTLIEQLIENHKFLPSSVGSNVGKTTCVFSEISFTELENIVNKTEFIFNENFVEKNVILNMAKNQKIFLQLMFDPKNPKDKRLRTFTDGKVSALQQGAGGLENPGYSGDRFVLVDPNSVCIQLFRVLNYAYENDAESFTQYMFGIYVPGNRVGFARKKQ